METTPGKEKGRIKRKTVDRENFIAETISLNNKGFLVVTFKWWEWACGLTSTPENALSPSRRIELCEKSKLRNGNCVVAYAYIGKGVRESKSKKKRYTKVIIFENAQNKSV